MQCQRMQKRKDYTQRIEKALKENLKKRKKFKIKLHKGYKK